MALTNYVFIKTLWKFPQILSKIFAWYGIATILDFICVAIIDCAKEDWTTGDLFKLYYFYVKRDGQGAVGIVQTVFIYIFLTFINISLYYIYLVFIHMNGRVIDLYYRLSGDINAFFIPRDDELSLNYLKWVCHKAIKKN